MLNKAGGTQNVLNSADEDAAISFKKVLLEKPTFQWIQKDAQLMYFVDI